MAEALVLGEAAGVDRAKLLEVMGASAVGSPFVEYKTEPLLSDDYSATFTTALMEKDVDLVLDLAAEPDVELPFAESLKALLARRSSAGTRTRTSWRSTCSCGRRQARCDERAGSQVSVKR